MQSKALASGRLVAILPLAALALVGGAYLLLASRAPDRETALDDDLCPTEDGRIAGSATLLLDLRKPLREARPPETLLRGISQDMGADTELRVYALGADPSAPRQLLGRLCKPYDNADLAIETAKDQRQALRDCDDLPAQIPQRLREAASRFCAGRGVLQERIQRLSERSPFEPVSNAYLMEALTETRREFAGRPQPWKLYLHSDMLQHAPWYSQLDLDWTRWRSGYDALDDALPPWNPPGPAGLTVTIHYLPRQNSTEPTRPRRLHQEFWRHWLQGADLAFRDEPPLPAYPFLPLMDLSSKEQGSPRPLALDSERQKTELLLARMAQAREELEAQQAREAQDEQARRQQEQELQRLERELQAMRERQSPPAPAAVAPEPPSTLAADAAEAEAPEAIASEPAAVEEAPSARPQDAAEPDAGQPAPAPEPQRQIASENASPTEPLPALEDVSEADDPELATAEEAPSVRPQVAAELDAGQPAPAPEPQRQIAAENASPAEPFSALEEVPEANASELAAAEDAPSARPQVAAEPDLSRPAPASEPQPQIVAEAQASAADSGDSGLAPCAIRLQPQFLAELEANDYPGGQRVHYGAGMLIVQYALDEAGATLDDQVSVRPQSADGFQPEDFQALARDTLEQVRSWAFDFEPPDGGACAKGGPRMATFEYRSKCVGAPVPSCRTVRANVALP